MSSIKVPYTLTCMVTGIQKTYTSLEFVNNKIQAYGGEQAMVEGYVCRDAKKALKAFDIQKLTVDDVKKVIDDLKGTADAQKSFDLIKSGKLFLTKKVKARATKTEDIAEVSAPKGASKKVKTTSKVASEKVKTAAKVASKKVKDTASKKKASSKKTKTAITSEAAPVSNGSVEYCPIIEDKDEVSAQS